MLLLSRILDILGGIITGGNTIRSSMFAGVISRLIDDVRMPLTDVTGEA